MSDFEPQSELPESTEQELFFHVDKLSFQKPLNIEIPYKVHHGSVQIYPSTEADKGQTQQPEAFLKILPPEQEGMPPVIEARYFQFSGGIELKRPVEVTRRLKDFEIIDVNGFPIMTIFDGENKKVRLVSLTPALLSEHKNLRTRVDRQESAARQLDMEQIFKDSPSDFLNIEFLLKIFHEQGANFFSLEESHEFWKKVLLHALEEAGVSDSTLSYFSNNPEEQWAAHLGMLSTLHGYLAMNMDGEKRFWDQVIDPARKLPTDKREIYREIEWYQEHKKAEFRRREWKIVDSWPTATQKPERDAIEVILPDKIRNGSVVGIYTDPETGLQIAVRVRNSYDGTPQSIAPIVGGKRDKDNPQFAEVNVYQDHDSNYDDLTADNFGKYSEQVSISDDEEMIISQHGWVDFSGKGVVIYDTPSGKKCIKFQLVSTLEDDAELKGRPRVVVEPNQPFIEEMLNSLDQYSDQKRKSGVTAGLEVFASTKAHEIATRIISVGKTIEQADSEYGINREKTKKIPLEASIDPSENEYRQIFDEHYNLIRLIEGGRAVIGEGTVFNVFMNSIFGLEERERLRDLQQRSNELVETDVVSDEEKKYRGVKGHKLSVKVGLAISQEEKQEFKDLVKKNVKALYCLILLAEPENRLDHSDIMQEDIFINVLTKTLSHPEEVPPKYAYKIAQELAFLSGFPNMKAQLEYLKSKVGVVNLVKYLPIWRKICSEVLNIKKATGVRTKQDLLKKNRSLSFTDQADEDFVQRLNRISVRIEKTEEGDVPDWILERLGLQREDSKK